MKKYSIAIVLILTLSLLICAVPAFAAQTSTVSLTASNSTVYAGDIFTVTVSASAVSDCVSGGFMFDYDEDVFEYVSGSALVTGYDAAGVSTVNNLLSGYFMGDTAANIEGDLFQVNFQVKDTAALGTYTITGTPSLKTSSGEVITYSVTDVTVTVACKHNMVETEAAVAATCEVAGKTAVMTCSVCGATEGGEEIPATGHNYVDGTCSCGATEVLTDSNLVLYKTNTSGGDLLLGDDIRASFIVNAKNLSYDRIYLEIVLNGESTIVEKLDNSTATVLRYAYVIPAAYMTSDVLVTVYGVKGEEVYRGEVLEFSVRKCIDAKMVNWVKAGSTANCNLAMALLDYGAKAQIQFKINTDNLATANLPEEYQQYLPNSTPALGTAPDVDTTGKTMTILNMGTLLQEKVKLSTVFKSTTAISDYSKITIEVKHHRSKDGEEIPYTFTSADTDYVEFVNNKNIRFYFDKIAPSQMRDELEITVYYDGVAVSPTYVRSVDMILNNANYLNNETMSALVYAIMNYGDAAKALFG